MKMRFWAIQKYNLTGKEEVNGLFGYETASEAEENCRKSSEFYRDFTFSRVVTAGNWGEARAMCRK